MLQISNTQRESNKVTSSSRPRHNPGRTAAATEHLSTSPTDHQHAGGSCHVWGHTTQQSHNNSNDNNIQLTTFSRST